MYGLPSKTTDGVCTKCDGANKGKPTAHFDEPLTRFVGRYVDSVSTGNVQNLGIRTVRARAIRVIPSAKHAYIALGEAVGAYKLDTMFTGKLASMKSVTALNVGRRVSGRAPSPFEQVAIPDALFYAESPLSGWATQPIDAQLMLTDFDADDRGLLYVGTIALGWGIARDPGTTAGQHMEFVSQVQDTGMVANTVISLKSGGKFFAVISQNPKGGGQTAIYDVTKPETPVRLGPNRTGASAGIKSWAKHEASSRLAIIDTAENVQIFDYAKFISGGAPLVTYKPTVAGTNTFAAIAFDPSGALWIAETTKRPAANKLHRAKPAAGKYPAATEKFDLYGGPFAPTAIDATGKFVVVAGTVQAGTVTAGELRLIRIDGPAPKLVPLGNFFHNFYSVAPAGFADPGPRVVTTGVRLAEQGGKTFLIYSAEGLGDVFEIAG